MKHNKAIIFPIKYAMNVQNKTSNAQAKGKGRR